MRTFKLLGALLAVLAVVAIAAASASAEETLWKFLPGKAGETFKGESGKATLTEKGGSTINCKKSEVKAKEGELLEEGSTEGKDATLALAFIHFSGCTAFGIFSAHSLGDAKGIILTHVEIHSCLISAGHFGLLIKPLPVHIEVETVNELVLVEGDFVAEISPAEGPPAKKFNLIINQSGGAQGIEKCEGGSAETLTSEKNENGTKTVSAESAAEGFFEFEKEAQEAMV